MKQRELVTLKDQKCWQRLVRQTHTKREDIVYRYQECQKWNTEHY